MDQGGGSDQGIPQPDRSLLAQSGRTFQEVGGDLHDGSGEEEVLEISPILLGEAVVTENLDIADHRHRGNVPGD